MSGNHTDNVPKETHVASVMTLATVALVRETKRTVVFSRIPFEGKAD